MGLKSTDYRVDIVNPLELPAWDKWVQTFERYSVFHSRSWAQTLADSYGYTPSYLVMYGNETPLALWPMFDTRSVWKGRKGVSLPFSDFCEPLIAADQYYQDMFEGMNVMARKLGWKAVELRGGHRFFPNAPTAAVYNFHILPLSQQEDEMYRQLRSSNKRNIKKAQKARVEISVNTSFESVEDFYTLNCLTRKHHGLPPQPFKFFKNIFRYLISKNQGLVVLAHHEQKLIAGAVFLNFGNCATYKYGASHRNSLALRPNNLIMWEAIKWYGRRGFKEFDLGRSEPDNRGLNQFKNGWGATVHQIAYYRYDPERQTFTEGNGALPSYVNEILRKMPIPVLRLIGTLAYPHMA